MRPHKTYKYTKTRSNVLLMPQRIRCMTLHTKTIDKSRLRPFLKHLNRLTHCAHFRVKGFTTGFQLDFSKWPRWSQQCANYNQMSHAFSRVLSSFSHKIISSTITRLLARAFYCLPLLEVAFSLKVLPWHTRYHTFISSHTSFIE